jgi:hypothetical protein
LFAQFELRPIRPLEIDLMHPQDSAWISGNYFAQVGNASASRAPSLEIWASYFPKATILGLDLNDFSAVSTDQFKIY